MAVPSFDLAFFRNDTFQFRFQVVSDQTLTPQNTSAWQQFWVTAKATTADADPGIIVKTLGSGIVAVDATTGLYEGTINPADTAAFGNQVYGLITDIQGKDPAGHIYTLARGMIVVSPDVQVGAS